MWLGRNIRSLSEIQRKLAIPRRRGRHNINPSKYLSKQITSPSRKSPNIPRTSPSLAKLKPTAPLPNPTSLRAHLPPSIHQPPTPQTKHNPNHAPQRHLNRHPTHPPAIRLPPPNPAPRQSRSKPLPRPHVRHVEYVLFHTLHSHTKLTLPLFQQTAGAPTRNPRAAARTWKPHCGNAWTRHERRRRVKAASIIIWDGCFRRSGGRGRGGGVLGERFSFCAQGEKR